MIDLNAHVIELARDLGYNSGRVDAMSGRHYGEGISPIRHLVRDMTRQISRTSGPHFTGSTRSGGKEAKPR
jgi:hypothetical protein